MSDQKGPATLTRKLNANNSKESESTSHFPQKKETAGDNATAETACISAHSKNLEQNPPKSRKELRAAKKALRKAAKSNPESTCEKPTELSKEEKRFLRFENRKALKKEERLLRVKEQEKERRLKKLKRLRGETNIPANAVQSKKLKRTHDTTDVDPDDRRENPESSQEDEALLEIYNCLLNGSRRVTPGINTLRKGVKYVDVVEGKGPVANDGNEVGVTYKLRGIKDGDFGEVIEASKNFYFHLGEKDAIEGWNIGVVGMREGGKRHLVVPPRAGYGSEDIGAGPGATLFFEITLLRVREG